MIIHKQGQAICSKNIVQSNDALRGSELARAQLNGTWSRLKERETECPTNQASS